MRASTVGGRGVPIKSMVVITSAIGLCVGGLMSYWLYNYLIPRKKKYKVVFVLGGPGSGKGTNCTRIKEVFSYVHLSAGDLLREESISGNSMINKYIAEGQIVPAEITVGLIRNAMETSGSTQFLIDGFPSDAENFRCWEKANLDVELQFVLLLDCPSDVMKQRVVELGKISGRANDTAESMDKRLHTYNRYTVPVIEHYSSIGQIRRVNTNRPQNIVFEEVLHHFQSVCHT